MQTLRQEACTDLEIGDVCRSCGIGARTERIDVPVCGVRALGLVQQTLGWDTCVTTVACRPSDRMEPVPSSKVGLVGWGMALTSAFSSHT